MLTTLTLLYPNRVRSREDGRFLLRYEYDKSGILRVKATLEKTGRVIFDKEIDSFSEKGTGIGASQAQLRALLTMNPTVGSRPPTPATAAQQIKSTVATDPARLKPAGRKCLVVDGSNLAWLGHTSEQPSYAQLVSAIDQIRARNPDADIRVVVDATLRHKVAEHERAAVEEALGDGRLVQPPAGTTGRGDALVAEIAAELDGIVVTNDNFIELHEKHPWLLDKGRVLGASRTGDLWVFLERRPSRRP